jgi:hypothetical protein
LAFIGKVCSDLPAHKQAFKYSIICRVKNHLEPLAVAINISQSAHCRLDQVLLVFGLLHHRYTTLKNQQPEDERACNAILESLERRWAKADQDVFVAAVILNPLHKIAPFAKSVMFSAAGVYTLLSRLWTRFYKDQPPPGLLAEMRSYFDNKGQYEFLATWIPGLRQQAQKEVRFMDTDIP